MPSLTSVCANFAVVSLLVLAVVFHRELRALHPAALDSLSTASAVTRARLGGYHRLAMTFWYNRSSISQHFASTVALTPLKARETLQERVVAYSPLIAALVSVLALIVMLNREPPRNTDLLVADVEERVRFEAAMARFRLLSEINRRVSLPAPPRTDDSRDLKRDSRELPRRDAKREKWDPRVKRLSLDLDIKKREPNMRPFSWGPVRTIAKFSEPVVTKATARPTNSVPSPPAEDLVLREVVLRRLAEDGRNRRVFVPGAGWGTPRKFMDDYGIFPAEIESTRISLAT